MNPKDKPPTLKPQMVSFYRLFNLVYPIVAELPGAVDDLYDIWKMGAPSPKIEHRPCPEGKCLIHKMGLSDGCTKKFGCGRVQRILLPSQFIEWWGGLAARKGIDLEASEVLDGELLKSNGKG